MWSTCPSTVPPAWRRAGAEKLADAVGFGTAPGPLAQRVDADAYVWYEKTVRKALLFSDAHSNASNLAMVIRAVGVVSGELDDVASDKSLITGLLLKRTAALPISQLGAFKAGATFVPLDPTWPLERTLGILGEAKASCVIADVSGNVDELTVRRRLARTRAPRGPPRAQLMRSVA